MPIGGNPHATANNSTYYRYAGLRILLLDMDAGTTASPHRWHIRTSRRHLSANLGRFHRAVLRDHSTFEICASLLLTR